MTVTNQQATILTAFIAIGITATGARSWKIYRFLLHQSRQRNKARDAMIREQEIMLRNAESDLCTLANASSLLWAWRLFGRLIPGNKLRHSKRSTVILGVVSLVHWLLFLVLAAWLPYSIERAARSCRVIGLKLIPPSSRTSTASGLSSQPRLLSSILQHATTIAATMTIQWLTVTASSIGKLHGMKRGENAPFRIVPA